MAYISKSRPRRTRGINFLLGGVLVAAILVGLSLMGGTLDLGVGAPTVRIDPFVAGTVTQ
ncbi:MAG: hypothetical protein AAFY65_00415 [Pseudomonadota bacterium]